MHFLQVPCGTLCVSDRTGSAVLVAFDEEMATITNIQAPEAAYIVVYPDIIVCLLTLAIFKEPRFLNIDFFGVAGGRGQC